jgi:hypothetical protein
VKSCVRERESKKSHRVIEDYIVGSDDQIIMS